LSPFVAASTEAMVLVKPTTVIQRGITKKLFESKEFD